MKKGHRGIKRTAACVLALLLFLQTGMLPQGNGMFTAAAEAEELLGEEISEEIIPEESFLAEEFSGNQAVEQETEEAGLSEDAGWEELILDESGLEDGAGQPAGAILEDGNQETETAQEPEEEQETQTEEETETPLIEEAIEADTEEATEEETNGLIEDPDRQMIPGQEPEETVTLKDAVEVPDSAPAGIMTFSLTAYDGCFGNQLEGAARKMYDERVNYYVTARGTGSMEVTYSLDTSPITFDAEVVLQENGTYLLDRTTQDYQEFLTEVRFAMQSSVDAFLYDHPVIFWFRGGKYSYIPGKVYDETTGRWLGYLEKVTYTPGVAFSGADSASMTGAYDSALAQVAQQIYAGADYDGDGYRDEVELVRGIHDYLCDTLYYDSASYSNYTQTGDYRIFCSAGAILPGSVGTGVVCEGYAKGFKVLCDQMGIPCVCIGGTVTQNGVTEGHMWNGVQIGGKWYLVDATWDDKDTSISYQYFLAANTFSNRVSSGNFGGSASGASTIFVYPYLETQGIVYCDAMGHDYDGEGTVTAPTCTEPGYTEHTCSVCGISYRDSETEALGHDYQVTKSEVTAPTCTSGGYTTITYTCSRCGASYTQQGSYTSALGHTYVKTANSAACTSAGYLTYTCSRCGSSYRTAQAALGHSYVNGVCSRCGKGNTIAGATVASIANQSYAGKAITPAVKVSFGSRVLKQGTDYTLTYRNNKNVGTASVTITGKGIYSGSKTVTFKIVKTSVATLKYSSVSNKTYNGKKRTPSVTVKNGSVKLTKNKDYTISYSKNKNIGRAVITIKGKGSYTGTKKIYFNIVPKKASLTKVVSNTKGRMGVTWKKVSGITGYQIQYSTSSSFQNAKTVTVKGKTSRVIKGLKRGKRYYVRIRTYKTVSKVKYYSAWSGTKKVTIKK